MKKNSREPGRPFDLDEAVMLLSRTPGVVEALVGALPEGWEHVREGEGTWSPFDVVGHLIHGEKTDWMQRARHALERGESVPFAPFDRDAQLRESAGRTLGELLAELSTLRAANVKALQRLELTEADLERRGVHPELGSVTLRQLLATWVAHDFDHVMQIARVLGRQYTGEVGPWSVYLRVISGRQG